MDCETLRERLAADPTRTDEAIESHVADCSSCQAFRSRLLRSEALIAEALRFDVKAVAEQAPGDQVEPAARRPRWITVGSGLAAGILTALTLWALFGGPPDLTPEELAIEVADHWYHEPEAWVQTELPVAASILADVLDGHAEIDLAQLSTVSYAESCWVAGERIPHLVVQGETGPYMVLLLPGRPLTQAVSVELADEGLAGHIMPVGDGSIAVLGTESAELEQIELAVSSAVDWTI